MCLKRFHQIQDCQGPIGRDFQVRGGPREAERLIPERQTEDC